MCIPVEPERTDPKSDLREINEPLPNSPVDEFFVKLKHDFRRPKPSEEAVAAALHAIQSLTGNAVSQHVDAKANSRAGERCPKCGAGNSGLDRFCGYCGTSLARSDKFATKTEGLQNSTSQEQHVYHHHYHHHYFPRTHEGTPAGAKADPLWMRATSATPRLQGADETVAAIQKLVQDWSLCCNLKRLDDLMNLYSSDAIVLRPNVAPAHGSLAIRQLLNAALESGLGDVGLECDDIGIVGDIACITGGSGMLVPIAAGEQQEETGKYLIVARREEGEWKIVADSWCMDTASTAVQSAAILPMRVPRK